MTANSVPEAALSVLPRADGSVRYSHAGYTITASANGPIEAQRRDEHPYEALVDVIVRPAAGVGGTRERHLESLLQSSLSELIFVQNFPRCLIQIVLQVEATPENVYVNTKLVQGGVHISIIPSLLQTAVLALLSAAVPMRATASTCLVAVGHHDDGSSKYIVNPSTQDVINAASVHALAFTSQDDLLLAESEGDFTMDEWKAACATAKGLCCRQALGKSALDMVLDDEQTDGPDMRQFLRSTMEAKTSADLHWR